MRSLVILVMATAAFAVVAGDDDYYTDRGGDDPVQVRREEEDLQNWQCGTDDFTQSIAYSAVADDCPHLKTPINTCCIGHDDCYTQQRGRALCDDTFCGCLKNVTVPSPQCHDGVAALFCELVKAYGAPAYDASIPKKAVAAAVVTTTTQRPATRLLPTRKNATTTTTSG